MPLGSAKSQRFLCIIKTAVTHLTSFCWSFQEDPQRMVGPLLSRKIEGVYLEPPIYPDKEYSSGARMSPSEALASSSSPTGSSRATAFASSRCIQHAGPWQVDLFQDGIWWNYDIWIYLNIVLICFNAGIMTFNNSDVMVIWWWPDADLMGFEGVSEALPRNQPI